MDAKNQQALFGRAHSVFECTVRDAIPMAVATVIVVGRLKPGQRVKVVEVSPNTHVVGNEMNVFVEATPYYKGSLGVIDPFILMLDHDYIEPGTRVLCLLNPGSTQNHRVKWDHPEIPN